MHIRGYVLGVMLLALVGWCMVQETIGQTRSRYRLAELSRREDEARKRLAKLRTQEDALRAPARLAALVRDKKMDLVALGSIQPDSPSWQNVKRGAERKPGEVLDEAYVRVNERDEQVNLAQAEW